MALLTDAGPGLVRLPDWPRRLGAFLRERRSLPYQYGVTDCACFAVDSVKALTGTDLAPDVERPRSAFAGGRFLVAHGFADIEAMMASMLGDACRWAHLRQARRGDLVSFFAEGETHLALCVGESALTPGPHGLIETAHDHWRSAWKVG